MKHGYLYLTFFLCIFFFTNNATAYELKFDRGAAISYAHQWCGGYNPKYKDDWGPHHDCANFVSQCLIDGFGGNPFKDIPGTVIIGKDGFTRGNIKAYMWASILPQSFCFKEVSLQEADQGDVILFGGPVDYALGRAGHHSGILNGMKKYNQEHFVAAHSNPHCFNVAVDYFYTYFTWPWSMITGYKIYHFQDDDLCKKCERYKDENFWMPLQSTITAELIDKNNKCQTCDSNTGDLLQKCYTSPTSYYLAKSCSPTSSRCEPQYSCNAETGKPTETAGGDCPDDTATVGTGVISSAYPPTNSASSIGIIETGFTYDVAGLLQSFKEEARLVKPGDLSPSLVSSMPLLIVPSGGFSGLDKSDFFKTTLSQYVNDGGNVLMLSQQHGTEFSVLPGGLSGFGWTEDMSCQSNSSYIDTWNAVLSGQTRTTPSLNVDGYFTQYPDYATVLLRRTANGQPAVLMYPYGKGNVIASTIYTDTAFTRGEASTDEKNLVRDIIAWAKSATPLTEIKAGQTANLGLVVKNNDATSTATAADITIYDPNKAGPKLSLRVPLNLGPGESAVVPLSYTASSNDPTGVYKTEYELLTEGYQLLTSEEDPDGTNVWLESLLQPSVEEPTGRFAIKNPSQTNYVTNDFNFSVQTSSETYLYGSNADFAVYAYNNTDKDRTITAKYFFPHHYWATYSSEYGGDWSNPNIHLTQTLTVPAKGSASFAHELNNVRTYDRLWAYFYDENGVEIGSSSRGFSAVTGKWNTSLSLDQTQYTWTQPIHIKTAINNSVSNSYSLELEIYVKDDNGNQVGYFDYPGISLPGIGTYTQTTDFNFSTKPKMGTYFVTAKVTAASQSLYNTASFTVKAPVLSVTTNLPTLQANTANNAQITIKNSDNSYSDNGNISLTLTAPDRQIVYFSSQNYVINPLQQQILNFPINPGNLKLGNYQLNYVISRALGDNISYTNTLANSYVHDFSLDKASYKIGETSVISLGITNTGVFRGPLNVAITVPDAGYQKNDVINAAPGQSVTTYPFTIPGTFVSGGHTVNVTVSLSTGTVFTDSASINILPSSLLAGQISGQVSSGGTITLPVSNTGGVDTTCQLNFSLADSLGNSVYSNLLTASVPVNGTQNFALQLPNQLADGYYLATYTVKDQKTASFTSTNKQLSVQGIKANIVLSTGKTSYSTTETINGTCLLSNTSQGSDITNGSLNLALYNINPFGTFNYPAQTYSGYNFIRAVGTNIWLGGSTNGGSTYIAKYNGTNLTIYDPSNIPMPHSASPQCMEVDNSGNLWFGLGWATTGALKFDGTNWTYYNLASYSVSSGDVIVKDNSGNLWFGGSSGAIAKYNGTSWTKYDSSNTGISFNGISCGICDKQGNLWFGTWGNGVMKFDGSHWYNYTTVNSNFDSNNITSIACDKNGTVYANTAWGWIYAYNNGTWSRPSLTGYWGGWVNLYASTTTNRLYVSDTNGSVIVYDAGKFVTEYDTYGGYYASPLLQRSFNLPAEDSSGNRWFANEAANSIFKYDGLKWTSYSWGMPGTYYSSLKIDPTGAYWVGNGYGLGRYFGGVWSNYYAVNYSTLDNINAVENGKNCEWIAAEEALYNFDGTNWNSYSYPDVYTLTYDSKTDTLWAGKWYSGLYSFNNGTWTLYNTTNSGIASNMVYSIAVDAAGKKWVGTGSGLSVFDGNTWTTYSTSNSPIPSNYISGVTIDQNNVKWLITGNGVSSYDGNKWVLYNLYPHSIFVDSQNTKWAGTDSGVSIFNGTTWDSFNSGNSPIDCPVYSIAEDIRNNAIVLLTSKGLIWYTRGNSTKKAIWTTSTNVNIPQNSSSLIPVSISPQTATGKYYLEGKLTSQAGQTVAVQDAAFYVVPSSLSLQFNIDKQAYKTGSTATIQGRVQNNSSVTANNINIKLNTLIGSTTTNIYNNTIPSLASGNSQQFSVTVPCNTAGQVAVSGTVSQNGTSIMTANDAYEVDSPLLTATLTTPSNADNNPFNISLQLQNTGKVDATVHLNASGPGLGNQQDITVPAGQISNVNYTAQILSDAVYTLTLTGDLQQTLTSTVKYGLAGTITILTNQIYPEGNVTLPVTLKNTGSMDLNNLITYDLTSNNLKVASYTGNYSLPKGGSFNGSVTFNNLPVGNYQVTASASNPNIHGQTSFKVVNAEDVSASVNMGANSGGNVPLTTTISNNGYFDFSGELVIESDFYNSSAAISIAAMKQYSNTVGISTATAASGTHDVTIKVLDLNNQILASFTKTISVVGPVLSIQLPTGNNYAAGSVGLMSFHIKNTGDQTGQASLNLKVLDALDKIEIVSVNPGYDVEVPFSFGIPEDLQTNDYFAGYSLTAGNSQTAQDNGQIKLHIDGIKIGVQASTDKAQYNVGDTAVLTVNVNNLNAGAAYNLFARVNYADYENRQDFTISGNNSLTFSIPLTAITGGKLFYGIYDETGRSIYLNSLYIYKAGQSINVNLDKQVYNPGVTVTASISSQFTGSLTLTAPNYSSTTSFTGNASISFALPYPMTAGTYGLSYQLNAADGSLVASGNTPFDVNGYQVKVPESTIDKGKYSPSDTVNASLTVTSNSAIPADIKAWIIDPSGNATAAGETNIKLTTDTNLIQNIAVPINTSSSGIHKLAYGIYDETGLLLCSGSKAFDVGNAVLLGTSTDKAEYATNNEPVKAILNMFGTSDGSVSVLVDNNQAVSNTVTLNGFSTMTTILPTLAPGSHTLSATLSSGGLTSQKTATFTYGANLPILSVSGATFDPMTSINCTLSAAVANSGKTASGTTSVGFYDGDPANGGQLIGSQPLGILQPGAVQQISQRWNILGKAGAHTVYVVADLDNLVSEFSRQYNQALMTVNIPNILMNNSLPQASYNTHTDISVGSQVTDLSSTTAFNNLMLKTDFIDPNGSVIIEKTNTIASIAPMGVAGVITTWNTGIYAPGNYAISQTLASSAGDQTYANNKLSFTILPTVNLSGSITLENQKIFIGQNLDCSYQVQNNGNVPIVSQTLNAVITTTGGDVSMTQEYSLDLQLSETKSGSFSIPDIQVAPGDYILTLTAVVDGKEFKIGESAFTVLPPLEISMSRRNWSRVLCYLKDLPNGPNPAKASLESTLNAAGVSFIIAASPAEFKDNLRMGKYNVILVVENQEPYQNLLAGLKMSEEELAEMVNGGEGLVFIKTLPDQISKLKEVSGADFNGNIVLGGYSLTAIDSPLCNAFSTTLTTDGVKAVPGTGKVVATLSTKANDPAIIINEYGLGRAVLFTFDTTKLDASSQGILVAAVNYVTREINNDEILPLSIQPISVRVKNLGSNLGIKLEEEIPANVGTVEALGASTASPLSWIHEMGNLEIKDFNYLASMPAYRDRLTFKSDISYLYKGSYNYYKSTELPLNITRDEMGLVNDICAAIDGLNLSSKDLNAASQIKAFLYSTSSNTADSKDSIETNISNIISAVNLLRSFNAPTDNIRLDMDKLLMLLQAKWHLAN